MNICASKQDAQYDSFWATLLNSRTINTPPHTHTHYIHWGGTNESFHLGALFITKENLGLFIFSGSCQKECCQTSLSVRMQHYNESLYFEENLISKIRSLVVSCPEFVLLYLCRYKHSKKPNPQKICRFGKLKTQSRICNSSPGYRQSTLFTSLLYFKWIINRNNI